MLNCFCFLFFTSIKATIKSCVSFQKVNSLSIEIKTNILILFIYGYMLSMRSKSVFVLRNKRTAEQAEETKTNEHCFEHLFEETKKQRASKQK